MKAAGALGLARKAACLWLALALAACGAAPDASPPPASAVTITRSQSGDGIVTIYRLASARPPSSPNGPAANEIARDVARLDERYDATTTAFVHLLPIDFARAGQAYERCRGADRNAAEARAGGALPDRIDVLLSTPSCVSGIAQFEILKAAVGRERGRPGPGCAPLTDLRCIETLGIHNEAEMARIGLRVPVPPASGTVTIGYGKDAADNMHLVCLFDASRPDLRRQVNDLSDLCLRRLAREPVIVEPANAE